MQLFRPFCRAVIASMKDSSGPRPDRSAPRCADPARDRFGERETWDRRPLTRRAILAPVSSEQPKLRRIVMMIQRLLLFAIFLSALQVGARAQEAAFYSDLFSTRPAVRYEEAKGVFHYVIPCKQYVAKGSQDLESAICWPVLARRLRMINGKFDFSDFVPGILTISATQVRFIPEVVKDMEFWNSIPLSGVKLADDPSEDYSLSRVQGNRLQVRLPELLRRMRQVQDCS